MQKVGVKIPPGMPQLRVTAVMTNFYKMKRNRYKSYLYHLTGSKRLESGYLPINVAVLKEVSGASAVSASEAVRFISATFMS